MGIWNECIKKIIGTYNKIKMNAFKTGMKFEKHVQSIFVKHGFHVFKETGGSKCGPDISILYNGVRVNFECKQRMHLRVVVEFFT